MSSQVLSPHYKRPPILVPFTHDDCDFKFSMACEWRVLFKEDKDHSLKFAKVFPAKFLSYQSAKAFPRHRFVLYGINSILLMGKIYLPSIQLHIAK